jgi:mannose-6-phosphate isomerase-like protein (cupin superfamily)
MKAILMTSALALCLAATAALAQPPGGRGGQPQQQFREDALDPSPVGAATDPVDINLWIGNYRNAKPRPQYGALQVRDILTDLNGADRLHPAKRGAVLETMHRVSQASLAPGASASGRAPQGDREVYYVAEGTGEITVNGKAHALKAGVGFTLTPDFDFKLINTGKTPLTLYVRAELLPGDFKAANDIVVVDRFDNDRRVGAHWAHICNGGPNGMNLCTIAPRTIPQQHSHPNEEVWLAVKGESILSLGKDTRRMIPGQAYRIPPTGLVAHSNINLGEEPIQLIYMGVAARPSNPPQPPSGRDFARLDNSPFKLNGEVDVDMFSGAWRDAFPRIVHGNLYFRDMLTALQGVDAQHPTRKGAVLTSADAVSYAMLEPNASAHRIDGELKGVQETFIVNSGTGYITQGGKRFELSKDKAFVITPGMDFKMTATGSKYLTFYVVTETLPQGANPGTTLNVVDNGKAATITTDWHNKERPLITRKDGLAQFPTINQVELKPMAIARSHSAAKDVEEIWIATDNDVDMLFGKQLRRLPAGTAYKIPPTGITAAGNFNFTDKPAHFLKLVK